jgi:hypothetical protein
MHVPHATNFYGKFEFLTFFVKKMLFQIKTAINFAYGLEKNRIIYEKLSIQILHPISTVVGCLHNLLFLKILKGNMKTGRF